MLARRVGLRIEVQADLAMLARRIRLRVEVGGFVGRGGRYAVPRGIGLRIEIRANGGTRRSEQSGARKKCGNLECRHRHGSNPLESIRCLSVGLLLNYTRGSC